MGIAFGSLGPRGSLQARRIPGPRPAAKARVLFTPFGRVILTRDRGQGVITSGEQLVSTLSAKVFGPDGRLKEVRELGSGIVLNCGVLSLAQDYLWTPTTLKNANFHSLGTSGTAAAVSDAVEGTIVPASNLTGSTNGYMTGTQSLQSGHGNVYQTVATFTCAAAGGLAITEWGLHTNNFATVTGTASSSSATGLGFSALGSAPVVGSLVVAANPVANGTTTTAMGLVTASSTTSVTIPAWFTLATISAVATTPGSTTAFSVVPLMVDHKTFAVINLAQNDTLQITYQLTMAAGG